MVLVDKEPFLIQNIKEIWIEELQKEKNEAREKGEN